jgi:hypothetical protein
MRGSTGRCSPIAGRTRPSPRTTPRSPRPSWRRRSAPELRAARIPLNAWGLVGSGGVGQEDYAYAASLFLARAIAERAGDEGLQAVWADARGGIGAYQPSDGGAAEIVDGPPDWRGLLDLLEGRTGEPFDDLWRRWVARDTDIPLLNERKAARSRYEAALEMAGEWRLPQPIRDALRAWRFEDATALLADAEAALAARGEVAVAARDAGLIAPATLRLAFEDDDGFDDSTAEATAELDVIRRYVTARELRPAEITPLLTLGLWGQTPDVELADARAAFARGDLPAAAAAADDAAMTWANAESLGQTRGISIGLIVLAAIMGLALLITTVRRRRRRRVTMQATRVRG